MEKKIPIESLGDAYGTAISMMYEVLANYSEELYTSDGNPKEDPGEVARVVDSLVSKLRHEASLIRDASYEYWESNAKPEQEALF